MGGETVLSVGGFSATDVTGAVWLPPHDLVYSVSPVYCVPGIYLFSCRTKHNRRLVGSEHKPRGYPDGVDYFEIDPENPGSGQNLFFYYFPDVQELDLKNLYSKAHRRILDLESLITRKAAD